MGISVVCSGCTLYKVSVCGFFEDKFGVIVLCGNKLYVGAVGVEEFISRLEGHRAVTVVYVLKRDRIALVGAKLKLLLCVSARGCISIAFIGYVVALIFEHEGVKCVGSIRSIGSCSACGRSGNVTAESRTGGCCHIFGDCLSEQLPSELGVVDKYVSVTLNVLHDLVSSHFPGINRVGCAPLEQHVYALEHLCYAVSTPIGAPSYVHVKNNSRNVTLNVVCGGVATAQRAVKLISSRGVYTRLGRSYMVKIGSAARGIVSTQALRPHVLAVTRPHAVPFTGTHTVACVKCGCVGGIVLLAVYLPDHCFTVVIRGNFCVSIFHEIVQIAMNICR